uniref:Uncharacterized protein n=1 Tax=Arundo donax TaxID=35708 RepID=A0A0A9F3N7_ARUDO
MANAELQAATSRHPSASFLSSGHSSPNRVQQLLTHMS